MPTRRDKETTITIAVVAAIFAVVAVITVFSFAPKNEANSPSDQSRTTGLSQPQQSGSAGQTGSQPVTSTSGVPAGGAGSDSTRTSSGPTGTTEGKDGESLANTGSAPRTGEQR
jgi:hypothetical protein